MDRRAVLLYRRISRPDCRAIQSPLLSSICIIALAAMFLSLPNDYGRWSPHVVSSHSFISSSVGGGKGKRNVCRGDLTILTDCKWPECAREDEDVMSLASRTMVHLACGSRLKIDAKALVYGRRHNLRCRNPQDPLLCTFDTIDFIDPT